MCLERRRKGRVKRRKRWYCCPLGTRQNESVVNHTCKIIRGGGQNKTSARQSSTSIQNCTEYVFRIRSTTEWWGETAASSSRLEHIVLKHQTTPVCQASHLPTCQTHGILVSTRESPKEQREMVVLSSMYCIDGLIDTYATLTDDVFACTLCSLPPPTPPPNKVISPSLSPTPQTKASCPG